MFVPSRLACIIPYILTCTLRLLNGHPSICCLSLFLRLATPHPPAPRRPYASYHAFLQVELHLFCLSVTRITVLAVPILRKGRCLVMSSFYPAYIPPNRPQRLYLFTTNSTPNLKEMTSNFSYQDPSVCQSNALRRETERRKTCVCTSPYAMQVR